MLSVVILLLLAEELEKQNEVKKFNNLSYVYVYILMSRGGLMFFFFLIGRRAYTFML